MIAHNPITLEIPQKSAEWYAARLGVITASGCEPILSNAQRKTYLYKLLAEKVTGRAESIPMTDAMEWGVEMEGEARKLYSKTHDMPITEVGFVYKNEDRNIGCSPDGLVGAHGLVEIKCPMTKTHIKYLVEGVPRDYYSQMQFQMYVTGRLWCHYVTYDPRPKYKSMRIKVVNVPRDENKITEIDNGVTWVLSQVEKFYKDYK